MGQLQEEIMENHNKPQLTVAGLWLELHPRSSRIQSRRVHAMAQADSCWPLTAEARFNPRPVHVEFVVNKVALGQALLFSEDLCSLLSASFYRCSILIQLLPSYIISATDSVIYV
jgi:hypothetical protein